jgi:alanyl aminopeptidase
MRRLSIALVASIVAPIGFACTHGPDRNEATERAAAHVQHASRTADASNDRSAKASEWNGHERLDDRAVPRSYDLTLRIDPERKTFSGETRIRVDIEEPTDRLRLHAESLEFETIAARRGDRTLPVEAETVEHGGLILKFDSKLERGGVTLTFDYEAPLDEVPEGLYRVEDGGDWYAFTQFEPLEAREAFPSFDEPRFKTPFEVTLTVPSSLKAFSNAPRSTTTTEGDWRTVEFQPTEPIPTYLVAFAVGPLEVVEAPEGALGDVPLRVLTPKGKADLADYALSKTPAIVETQMQYFDDAFPFQKLDLVAVPNFKAGAMENVGLVTFRESILLLDPKTASARDAYWAQSIIAHETAHMWFGNDVTLAWWDDLWLNEAFATWMEAETLAETAPELEPRVQSVRRMLGVMDNDSLSGARAIRQPIEDGGDVYNAFDSITYTKGMAILRMFEAWMGDEAFRSGVRHYLETHAYGVAETSDLLEALDSASDRPVRETLAPFLDQPGVPLVETNYDREQCRREGTATLQLRQSRYRPVGSDVSAGEPWPIPMCVRYPVDDGSTERYCFRFDGSEDDPRRQTVELPAETCPAWVHPNAGERGYYHWKVTGDGLEPLWRVRNRLTLPETVALLPHLEALVRADTLPVGRWLEAMEAMADETHRMIVGDLIGTLRTLESRVYRHDPPEAFRAYAASIIEPHLQRIGFEAKADEPIGNELLRPKVIGAAASLTDNQTIIERARNVTETFLSSPDAVPATQVKMSLPIAARRGDKELWTSMRRALSEIRTPSLRSELIRAMGRFRDPELVRKSLDLFWTDAIRAQNLWALLGPASGHPKTREIAWNWMTEHYDRIVGVVGEASAGRLTWVGNGFCSQKGAERVRQFFSKDAHRTKTTERNLRKTLSSIEQCRRYRDLVSEETRRFIRSRETASE